MSKDYFADRVHDLVKGLSLYPGNLSGEIVLAVIGRLSSHIERSISIGVPIAIWMAVCEFHQGCKGIVSRGDLLNALVSKMPCFCGTTHIGRIAYLESLEMLRVRLIKIDQKSFLVGQNEAKRSFGTKVSSNVRG